MNYKKSQSSLEFLLIFIFVFILIFLLSNLIFTYIADINRHRNLEDANDFADKILREYQIMQKVQNGYSREIEVPSNLLSDYELVVEKDYILIKPRNSSDYDYLYYDLSGQGNLTLIEKDLEGEGLNKTYLLFKRG